MGMRCQVVAINGSELNREINQAEVLLYQQTLAAEKVFADRRKAMETDFESRQNLGAKVEVGPLTLELPYVFARGSFFIPRKTAVK